MNSEYLEVMFNDGSSERIEGFKYYGVNPNETVIELAYSDRIDFIPLSSVKYYSHYPTPERLEHLHSVANEAVSNFYGETNE